MKTIGRLTLTAILVSILSLGSTLSMAQGHNGKGNRQDKVNQRGGKYYNIPNLTSEQKQKMEDLRLSSLKKMKSQRNILNEKQAHLNTLRTADNVNMNEIYKTVEEIGAIRTQMHKDKEAHHQEIRKILDEKQRIYFDSKHHKKGSKYHAKGNKRGKAKCDKKGNKRGKAESKCCSKDSKGKKRGNSYSEDENSSKGKGKKGKNSRGKNKR